MEMNAKKYFTIGVVLFALGGLVFFITGRSYPVATVNGAFVSARDFSVYYSAAKMYFAKVQDVATSTVSASDFEGGLKQSSLEILINQELVKAGLTAMLGDELSGYVDKKIKYLREDKNLGGAVRELYGLSESDFEKLILLPAALDEILSERFYLDEIAVDDWLNEQRLSADIVVLLPGFAWKEGEVVAQ